VLNFYNRLCITIKATMKMSEQEKKSLSIKDISEAR